jgi:hypothetical protein
MTVKNRFTIDHPPFDDLVKSRLYPVFVIPAKAGIQVNQAALGSRLRGSDGFSDFLRDHPHSFAKMFLRIGDAAGISPRIQPNGIVSFRYMAMESFYHPSGFIAESKQVPSKNQGTCPRFSELCTATLIPAKVVIPAKAGIQEKTGFRSLLRA